MRYALIDLGSNTFHLIIIEKSSTANFKTIYKKRFTTGLGKGNILNIPEKNILKAISTLKQIKIEIKEFDVKKTIAVGTAAFRMAQNKADLVHRIKEETGLSVNVIDGKKEAQYIQKGVELAIPTINIPNYLIMDIGGGSVEFILVQNGQTIFSSSYKIGMALLFQKFQPEDPISQSTIQKINTHLSLELKALTEALQSIKDLTLIGASGTFDILDKIVARPNEKFKNYTSYSFHKFYPEYDKFIFTTNKTRVEDWDIPADRSRLFIVAFILINFVGKTYKPTHFFNSKFALKEGLAKEIIMNYES